MNAAQEVDDNVHNPGPRPWKAGLRVLKYQYLNANRSLGVGSSHVVEREL